MDVWALELRPGVREDSASPAWLAALVIFRTLKSSFIFKYSWSFLHTGLIYWYTFLVALQARIQEFSSGGGGPTFRKFLTSKKINKRPKVPLSLTWVQSTLQKFDFGMEPKTTTLHPTCFKITAMHSVCCYNLLKKFLKCVTFFWWIGQGGNFYSLFDPNNTNLVKIG